MKAKDMIAKLKSYRPDDVVVGVVWTGEDILERGREMGYDLDDHQVAQVAEALYHKHDCNIGINWDTITYWIDELTRTEKWVLRVWENNGEDE